MSSQFFDYIQAIKPSLGDEKRARIGLLFIHYITLARVSGGHVRIDHVLTTSGSSFVQKVLRNISVVRDLAFALKVDTSCIFDDSPVPEGLRRQCEGYHIDVEACISRNKSLERARNEMWDLVIFVRVAQAIMTAVHEESWARIDESYVGHRLAGYKPRSKWFGLRSSESTPALRAKDLPRAKAPRPVGAKARPAPTPVAMSRNQSDKSSGSSSSSSSGSESRSHKRPAIRSPPTPPIMPPPARLHEYYVYPVPMATHSQAAYIAQRAAMAAYYQSMQQGTAGRSVY